MSDEKNSELDTTDWVPPKPMKFNHVNIPHYTSDTIGTGIIPTGVSITNTPIMRTFESGANRHTDQGKLKYEGFLSPIVLRRYAEYMHRNRIQADGNLRNADNWQLGINKDIYIDSGLRHLMDVWLLHRGFDASVDDIEEAICGVLFNLQGYLFELLKDKNK